MQVEKTVFISYRRTNIWHARAIFQNLRANGYDAFLDIQNIDSGAFDQTILSQIKARAHFVLVLTPSALERCANPEDWLRREIETAMDHQRNIVPLLFDGFDYRDAQPYLTGRLATLNTYNGVNVPWDYFEEAMDRLCARFLNKPLEMILHPVTPDQHARASEIQQQTAAAPVPTPEQLKATEYFEKGVKAYFYGQPEQAVDEFSRALLFDTEHAEAYYRRGHAYRMMHKKEEAISDFEKATRLEGESVQGLLYECNLYRMQEDYPRALKALARAVRNSPNEPEVWFAHGALQRLNGNPDGAISDYTKGLNLKPSDAAAFTDRGNAYADTGDLDSAIADYSKALHLNPQDTGTVYNRGIAYFKKGDLASAIADFSRAISLKPENATAYVNRGISYERSHDLVNANADYQRYIELGGDEANKVRDWINENERRIRRQK